MWVSAVTGALIAAGFVHAHRTNADRASRLFLDAAAVAWLVGLVLIIISMAAP